MIQVGLIQILTGATEAAQSHFSEALKIATAIGNMELEASALSFLATVQGMGTQNDRAEAMLTRSLAAARKAGSIRVIAHVLDSLANAQITLRKFDEAMPNLDEALRIAQLNDYGGMIPFVRLNRAKVHFARNQPRDAEQELEQTKEAAEKLENSTLRYTIDFFVGQLHVARGDWDRAIPLFESLRAQARRVEIPVFEAGVLEAIAMGYAAKGNTERSIESWMGLLRLSEKIGSKLMSADAQLNLGLLYEKRGEADPAVSHLEAALADSRDAKSYTVQASALVELAGIYGARGDDSRLIALADEALTIADQSGVGSIKWRAYITKGSSLLRLEKPQEAIDSLQKAIDILTDITTPSREERSTLKSALVLIASAHGKLGQALLGIARLQKAAVIARQMGDEAEAKRLLEVISKVLMPETVLQESEKFRSRGELEASAYLYTLYGVQLDLSARQDELAKVMPRLGDILGEWLKNPEGTDKLSTLYFAAGGTDTAIEAQILSFMLMAYINAGEKKLADDAALALVEVLNALKDRPVSGLFLASACLASQGIQDNALAVELAGLCKQASSYTKDPAAVRIGSISLFLAYLRDKRFKEAEKLLVEISTEGLDVETLVSLRLHLAFSLRMSGDTERARDHIREALRLAEQAGNDAALADAHQEMGNYLAQSSQSGGEALKHFTEARELLKKTGDKEKLVRVLLGISELYIDQGDPTRALGVVKDARHLAESVDKKGTLCGDVMSRFGEIYLYLGQKDKSLRFQQDALACYRKANATLSQNTTLLSIAETYAEIGDRERALQSAMEGLKIAEQNEQDLSLYLALSKLAKLYDDWGDFELAIQYRQKALETAQRMKNASLEAEALTNLSYLQARLGDLEAGPTYAARLEEILKTADSKKARIESTLELLSLYSDRNSVLRDPEKAERLFQKAVTEAADLGEEPKKSMEFALGQFYFNVRRFKEAIPLLESVTAFRERTKSEYGLAASLLSLSQAYSKIGRIEDAASCLEKAAPIVRRQNDVFLTGSLYYYQASFFRDRGRFQEAVEEYKKVTELIEQGRRGLSGQVRLGITVAYEFIYDELLDALFGMHQRADESAKSAIAREALQVAEENKARQFSEALASTLMRRGVQGVPLELLEKEHTLTAQRDALFRRVHAPDGEEKASRSQTATLSNLTKVSKELRELIQAFRKDFPSYADLKYPEPVELDRLPLKDGEIVIVYNSAEEATFLWGLAESAGKPVVKEFRRLPIGSSGLGRLVDSFRQPFVGPVPNPDKFDPEVSAKLFSLLLGPLGSENLRQYKRVFIIPDGDLNLLPFEWLTPRPDSGEYIFENLPISYYPSLTAMALARLHGSRPPTTETLFAVGDPVSDPNDERYTGEVLRSSKKVATEGPIAESPQRGEREVISGLRARGFSFYRLPATALEVDAIEQILRPLGGTVETRVGFAANKTDLLATDLSRFRFLHFATHGILPQEVPSLREPALVLSIDESEPRNMFLTMTDILSLQLNAEVVTLSACETGLGKNLRAEGILGLPRAFMFAGASAVVVSLWKVADDSTADLMREFYSNMAAGKDKALSLALARRKVRESGKTSPFFWAPFIMWGE